MSELIGAMSYALDIAEGEPPGHAKRACLIGMRLADVIGLDPEDRADLFYALLLKDAGCSANSARMAALFGADDQQAKRTSKLVDWARPVSAFVWSLQTVAEGGSFAARVNRLRAISAEGEVTKSLMLARCDRGAEIARMLGFSDRTAEAIRALDEHWNGRGQPRGLRGSEIPLAGRILCLAQTAEVFNRARGAGTACEVAVKRSGQWFDPMLVDALTSFGHDAAFWASLTAPDLATVAPSERVLVVDDEWLDRIANGFAAVIDVKSPWTHQHSDRAWGLVRGIGTLLEFEANTMRGLGRAAQLHDIGKLAISNRILDKPGRLTDAEFAMVREHPLVTQQILERVPGFSDLSALAGSHHERLDGSGYPHGLTAAELTMPMRVLAIADVYEALTAERPYRPAFTVERALEIMRTEIPQRLDREAFAALEMLLGVQIDDPAPELQFAQWALRPEGPRRR